MKRDFRYLSSVVGLIANSKLKIAKCLYCLGEPVEALLDPLSQSIQVVKEHDGASLLEGRYATFLEMISLCILLDVDQSWFEDIVVIVDRDSKKDRLAENLLSYKLEGRQIDVATSTHVPNTRILNALTLCKTDKQSAAQEVCHYLTEQWIEDLRWLSGGAKVPHLEETGYFGYWDYVSPAVTKPCELDDSSYRDSRYYPADLMPRS